MRGRFVFTMLVVTFMLATPARGEEGTLFGMERRRDQFPTDFGYFVYPISGKVPGIGTAYGAGGTVTNVEGTDTDFTGFAIRGDFEATGALLLNYHLIDERLIFDLGNYTAKVAPQGFRRGIGSSRDDVLHLEVESEVTVAQTTLTFYERMLEFYGRYGFGAQRLNRVLDADGKPFENVDNRKHYFQALSLGGGAGRHRRPAGSPPGGPVRGQGFDALRRPDRGARLRHFRRQPDRLPAGGRA
ncbi:MAG: hypothetical protein HQK87_03285 [Nitrospinae bacterium]|nr:hypothetical protein [Nitrospinota bacterium]